MLFRIKAFSASLSHHFGEQNAWYNGKTGKMILEEIFLSAYILLGNDSLTWNQLQDSIYKDKSHFSEACGLWHAAFEIPVEGTHTNHALARRLALADARAAGTFQNSRTGGNQLAQSAVLRQDVQHLP